MKKLFLFIICAVLSIEARAQFSGSGNGTEADPYRIYTDIHLAQMANFLNQEGVVFELMKDVDLSSYISENSPSQGWMPIGVESIPFKGILKGNNHTISGLYINRPNNDNIGLFGCVNGANIGNLTIKASSITGQNYVGVLCGNSYGQCSFTNCDIEISNILSGLCDIGSIVGFMHEGGNISDCNIKGIIESKSSSVLDNGTVGGIGGTVYDANIINCTYIGDITGKLKVAGGLVGSIHGCSLSDCTAKSPVTGEECVGGLCGNASETNTIQNCRHEGDVFGTSYVSGGIGLLESSSSTMFNNFHHKGTITNSGDYTGGCVGKSEGGGIAGMEDCSHFGSISGQNYVGGIVGAIVGKQSPTPQLNTYHVYETYGGPDDKKWYSANIFLEDKIIDGETKNSIICNCSAIGNIDANDFVGGLLGYETCSIDYGSPSSTTFTNNGYGYKYYKNGTEYGNAAFGYIKYVTYRKRTQKAIVDNSYYCGNIIGGNHVGGISGEKEAGEIKCCYAHGSIYGKECVGGIVGMLYGVGTSSNSQANPCVINSNVENLSEIYALNNVGRIYGSATNENVSVGVLASSTSNRALTQTKVILCGVAQDVDDNEQNGTSVGPSMLRLKANYVSWGWDFDDNWNIIETESYPYKKYQAAPPVIESTLLSQDTNVSGKSMDGGTVYMFYKARDAVSTDCDGHNWSFTTEALQSGAQIQLYADVEGLIPSYLTSATVKYPGSGTEEDPYRIYTAEDLQGATNSGYYKLMNDIDLTDWINENSPETGWPAIGRNSTLATYIDGDGHKVSGLWINTTAGYNGLFSNYSAGYIKNLNVEVASGKKIKGGDYTGILIGRMFNGQIINCSIKGDVEGTVHVGGVLGYVTNSTVANSTFEGKVYTTVANAFAGGVSGLADNVETKSCQVAATFTTTGENTYVGGLYGKTSNGNVTKSTADAKITASGTDNHVGGLVGRTTSPITLCYSTGTVTASGNESYTGGLVGYAETSIANSYSTANVNGTQYTAGLVGYTLSTVDKCYASGNIAGVMYGAGLVGELDGADASATNSIAANNKLDLSAQSSWGCRVIGGFKNGCAEPNNSNYALSTMQVSLNNVPQKKTDDTIEGIAKPLSDLQMSATYIEIGWDFEDIWTMGESGYPELKCFAAGPATPDFIVGDVNNDGNITMSDVVSLISHIMGTTLDGFNANAADINGDTEVKLSDVVLLIDKIMGKTSAQAAPRRANVFLEAGELYAANYNADALTLGLSNATSMTAVQMDIVLPEGIEMENIGVSSKHIATWTRLSSGKTRVMIYSPSNKNFDGNNIATLHLTGNSADKGITIEAISECAANGREFDLANLELGSATAIRNIHNENEPMNVVTISGQSLGKRDLRSLTPGVYVVNGKKYIIK